MTIQGTLTPEDYFEAMSFLTRPFVVKVIAWGSPILLVPFFTVPLFVQVIWGVLVGFYFLFLCSLISSFGGKQRSAKRPGPFTRRTELHGLRKIEITPQYLEIKGPHIELKFAWTHFSKYKIGSRILLLIHNRRDYQILPKSWFTPDQLNEFQRFLRPS